MSAALPLSGRSLRALVAWGGLAAVLALLGPLGGVGPLAAQEPDDAASVRRGEALYSQNCSACHGGDGRGGLTIEGFPAPPLNDTNPRMTIAYTRLVMDTGRMPPAGDPADNRIRGVTLTEQERSDITAWMTATFGLEGDVAPPPPGEIAEGLRVYAANCAACHGASGAGGVAGGGAWTPRVNDVDPLTLARAVRTGPFQMPRFDAEQISDAEIGDMAAFLADVEEEGGTLLFPGELNPVFASGFGAGLAVVIIFILLLIAGRPTMFPDAPAPGEQEPTA
jgi:ubiquinol-cytochrome c reductase cytochrome c subunit